MFILYLAPGCEKIIPVSRIRTLRPLDIVDSRSATRVKGSVEFIALFLLHLPPPPLPLSSYFHSCAYILTAIMNERWHETRCTPDYPAKPMKRERSRLSATTVASPSADHDQRPPLLSQRCSTSPTHFRMSSEEDVTSTVDYESLLPCAAKPWNKQWVTLFIGWTPVLCV